KPAAFASNAGNITQTLVQTPAMIKVFLPVARTVLTKSSLSHALTSPFRGTYTACGANCWISGISGPFGPFGSEAVVMTGIFKSVASFASIIVFDLNSVTLMSFTVWNKPAW